MTPTVAVIDFETSEILPRPYYPPHPVGVSILLPGRQPQYYAWGHPTGNNCTKQDAENRLKAVRAGGYAVLMHNAKFDVDVVETYFGIHYPQIHDTQFLLFLADPHAETFSLKPSAERLLKMKPDERDAVRDWLIKHQPNGPSIRITESNWGAYISLAPGNIVGPYANGDTRRTLALFNLLYPLIVEAGMQKAYEREIRLLPILLRNEREGIRVDQAALAHDIKIFTAEQARADAWLCRNLNKPDLNLDSPTQLADALDDAGVIASWTLTAKGNRSTSKKNLKKGNFSDPRIWHVLGYRSRLETALSTFMRPWSEQAKQTGGLIHTEWNQVRRNKSDDSGAGARTGRLSASRFQNMPKRWQKDGYEHPTFARLTPLPWIRKYVLPDKGQVCLRRDYNQQELRILAHFEQEEMYQGYMDNPMMDAHDLVQTLIHATSGLLLDRDPVKILNFGEIYGMGTNAFMEKLERSEQEVKTIMRAKNAAFPGIKRLGDSLKKLGKAGEPIRTWGGRIYYSEPAKWDEEHGRDRDFHYKLLNYLIQGSAADCTKESIIRYDDVRRDGRFMLTVHDELDASVARKALEREALLMRDAMMSVEFDVLMLSDAEWGVNLGELNKLVEHAPILDDYRLLERLAA